MMEKADLMEIKIGKLVRNTLPQIITSGRVANSELDKLQQEDYCKIKFDMNFPVLKLVNTQKPLIEQRMINGYHRYYSKPVDYNDRQYLITNDWYDRNQEAYVDWLVLKQYRLKNQV